MAIWKILPPAPSRASPRASIGGGRAGRVKPGSASTGVGQSAHATPAIILFVVGVKPPARELRLGDGEKVEGRVDHPHSSPDVASQARTRIPGCWGTYTGTMALNDDLWTFEGARPCWK